MSPDRGRTYLVCDIVGSTALADAFDVEDVAAAVGTVITTAILMIERFGGTVEDVAGDGVVGAFGADNEAVTDAVRAGLEISEVASRAPFLLRPMAVGTSEAAVTILVRVGIEVGDGGSNLDDGLSAARRLESAAAPGSVLVGPRAHGRVDRGFTWDRSEHDPHDGVRARSVVADVHSAETRRQPTHRVEVSAKLPDRQERKTVVVLFGALDRAAGIDPGPALQAARRVIESYGGWSAATGDRVLGLFGAPAVHEDDGERAVRAGLDIVQLATEMLQSARVGIAVGPVVLGPHGAGQHSEYTALGDAVNTASRLQGAAMPNSVVVSDETLGFVATRVEVAGEYDLSLKGKAQPVRAVVVSRVSESGDRPHLASVPLVGRERQLMQVAQAVERFVGGIGALVLIEGEAGLGKSRLADDTCAIVQVRVSRAAVRVLRAASFASAVPFWPMRSMINRWLDNGTFASRPDDLAVLRLVVGSGPNVAVEVGDDGTSGMVHRRARALIVEELVRQHDDRPTVLVFEDVHWADVHTIGLIEQLVSETRMLVLATCRPDDSERVAPLRTSPTGLRIELDPLSHATSSALLDAMAGPAVLPWSVERRILALAEGNPFFLEQLVRGLIGDGRLIRRAGGWSYVGNLDVALPDSVERVVLAHLEILPRSARAVLDAAAVLRANISIDLLDVVVDGDFDVAGSLAVLVKAALLVESAEDPGDYRFSHVLLQETAHKNLLRRHRERLHTRCAAALVQLRRHDHRVWEDIARHAWEGGDAVLATDWAEQAGADAEAHLSFAQAARCYRLAGLATARLGRRGPATTRIGLALGGALRRDGDLEGAMDAFAQTAVTAADGDDPVAQAHAALGFEEACYASRRPRAATGDPSTTLLVAALAALPSSEEGLVARLSSSLAVAVSFAGDNDRGLQLSDAAIRDAGATGDPAVIARALHAWRLVRRGPAFLSDRYECTLKMLTAAGEAGDPEFVLEASRLRLIDELELGRMRQADRTIAEIGALAHMLRQPLYLWYPMMWRAMRLLYRGRLAEADEAIVALHSAGRRYGYNDIELVHGLLDFLLRREQGRASDTEARCRQLAESTPHFRPVVAALAVELGRPGEARDILDDYVANQFSQVPRDQAIAAQIAMLADAATATGHAAAADTLHALAKPFERQQLVVGSGAVCFGATSHVLGRLTVVTGPPRQAAPWFARAFTEHRASGSALLAAYSACEEAAVLGLGRERASGALLRAERVARLTGSVRLARRVTEVGASGGNGHARAR